jgi:hypothetical protein
MQVDNKILTSAISKFKLKWNNKKEPIEMKVMKKNQDDVYAEIICICSKWRGKDYLLY